MRSLSPGSLWIVVALALSSGACSPGGMSENADADAGPRPDTAAPAVDAPSGPTQVLATAPYAVRQLRVDATSIYWAEWTATNLPGRIMTAPKVPGGPTRKLAECIWDCDYLALGDADVYYTEYGAHVAPSYIRRVDKAGASAPVAIAGAMPYEPTGISFDAALDNVLWADGIAAAPHVRIIPRNGGTEVDVSPPGMHPEATGAIVLDDVNVYFGVGNEIWRAPKDGSGAPVRMATDPAGSIEQRLALSATDVYWVNYGTGIRTVPKTATDATPTTVVAMVNGDLTVDDQYLYWTDYPMNTVNRLALATPGAAPEVLIDHEGAGTIAHDDQYLYWVRGPWGALEIVRFRKP